MPEAVDCATFCVDVLAAWLASGWSLVANTFAKFLPRVRSLFVTLILFLMSGVVHAYRRRSGQDN
jgi:hypothetical protein